MNGAETVSYTHLDVYKRQVEVRLPTEREWLRLAGGEDGERYPWDGPTRTTTDKSAILTCANTDESGINLSLIHI